MKYKIIMNATTKCKCKQLELVLFLFVGSLIDTICFSESGDDDLKIYFLFVINIINYFISVG